MTGSSSESTEELMSVFEERAENLSWDELKNWTALTPHDEGNLEKLSGPGAKLLIGPRGSGKSTLMRSAYFRLFSGDVLPVYVNYARSLALEPLFHSQANALQIFRQWLLCKIVVGAEVAMRELGRNAPSDLLEYAKYSTGLIRKLESGQEVRELERFLSPSELVEMLERWAQAIERKRVVLFLDDAAHAFSPEQQREFFEVFRDLRSRRVSGKAAVYPGITSYSPFFHVGHEAELLEAWYRPDEADYLATMHQIVERRLPATMRARLAGREELIDLIALASFGLPRGFLNMLSQLLGVDEDPNAKPTRSRAERAIRDHAESVRGVFGALVSKLPRFKKFVEIGKELEGAIVGVLRSFNARQEGARRASVIGIEEPLEPQLERTLKMLEYAGVVRRVDSVSRGIKGVFVRYSVHYAILISENAMALGKSYQLASLISALTARDSHAFARGKGSTLLGKNFEARCTLDLPPCTQCGATRVAEEQRFCMRCGSELANASVYDELLQASLSLLPITAAKVSGILEHTSLRTVQDLLMDDELQTLRQVPYIGPVWSARIRNYAEEFVSV